MPELTWTKMIEILDTAIKIGLGAFVGVVGAYVLERYRRQKDRAKEAEQRLRDNLESPVVAFVDEMLGLISRAYWNKVEGREPGTAALIEALRDKEASIEARLKAMERPDVEKCFAAVDGTFVQFRREIAEGSLPKARDLMKEAQRHAGALFKALYGMGSRGSI